jgi:radical SAM protein with 4Fe4S-binding SPASM domain
MQKVEKIMNKRFVRRLFHHYANSGKRRIDELFGDKKEKTIRAFFGRLPLQIAIDAGMKRIGLTEQMKKEFLSKNFNKQTLLNILNTVSEHGLKLPFRFDGPLLIVWNYTNLCNLRCRYCYQSAGNLKSNELTFEEKIDVINQMVDANTSYLALSGGEPIMGDRFWDILSYASKFLHVTIATNGTLLEDRRLVERLADYGTKNVFVSLDGSTQKTHDFIRGNGNFQRTIRGIENLVNNEYLHVGINTVVTRRNFDEVPAILNLAKELGVDSFSHYNFIPTGRGKDAFDQDLTPEQRETLLNMLYDWHMKRHETKLNIISTSPAFARILYDRSSGGRSGLFHYTADNATALTGIIKYAGGCGAGRVYAALQPDGKVSPCVFMPAVTIGNIRERSLLEIWQGSELCKQLSDRENYHFYCRNYQYICGGCRARAYAYGDILGADPGCMMYKKSVGVVTAVEEMERERITA